MKKGFLFTLAAALTMFFVACDPESNEPDNQSGGNNYSQLLVGKWLVDNMTVNGEDMTPQNMHLTFEANGRGLMEDGGPDENNDFDWVINGNDITVTTHHDQFTFTITSLTATECSFTGSHLEMDGVEIEGTILFHMTKVNGGDPNPPTPPTPGAFPAGTMWTCSMDETETETDEDGTWTYVTDADIIMEFASTGNNGTLDIVGTMTIMLNGATVYSDNINESDTFTWTYNEATQTGTITQSGVDEGQPYEETLDFTYNPANETIVIVYTDDEDPEADPITYVFQRTRK